ncbi:MAG: rane-flanked domain, partial [Pseudonocardia sp.]|nr:rane-flanked domain [Pseudonocardia sp.]
MLAPREIDEYVLPTERRIIRVREHWAVMLNPILQSAAVLLLIVVAERTLPDSVFLDNLAFYGALVVVVRFTILVLLWWVERIVVTDKRVMKSEGIIVHKVGMMPLSKVTDLSFVRSLNGRIFGYGKIVIESAGQNQAF